jgi:hypothetical protein
MTGERAAFPEPADLYKDLLPELPEDRAFEDRAC